MGRVLLFILIGWIVISVFGFLFKAVLWLAILGLIGFVVTSAIGWNKRDQLGRH